MHFCRKGIYYYISSSISFSLSLCLLSLSLFIFYIFTSALFFLFHACVHAFSCVHALFACGAACMHARTYACMHACMHACMYEWMELRVGLHACMQPVVEYVGSVVRNVLSDKLEALYELQRNEDGSCYMFRLDDNFVVDATRKGSVSRFINHSCAVSPSSPAAAVAAAIAASGSTSCCCCCFRQHILLLLLEKAPAAA